MAVYVAKDPSTAGEIEILNKKVDSLLEKINYVKNYVDDRALTNIDLDKKFNELNNAIITINQLIENNNNSVSGVNDATITTNSLLQDAIDANNLAIQRYNEVLASNVQFTTLINDSKGKYVTINVNYFTENHTSTTVQVNKLDAAFPVSTITDMGPYMQSLVDTLNSMMNNCDLARPCIEAIPNEVNDLQTTYVTFYSRAVSDLEYLIERTSEVSIFKA